jgi:hypothetical protein
VNGKVIGILIMVLLILILLGVLIYYIVALFDTLELLTDCEKYNKNGTGTLPKKCPAGREYYLSLCYKKCLDGYRRASACGCEIGEIRTDCELLGVTTLPTTCLDPGREYYGSTCVKRCPDGWYRTAGCTCAKGDTLTNCEKHGKAIPPTICPSDRELYGSTCVKKCPAGYKRTGSCTCERGELFTTCDEYGAFGVPTICPSDRENYGSTCVRKCDDGYTRTAACTCVKGSLTTNCDEYGFKSVLGCPSDREYIAGICYTGCPDGGERIAACTCRWDGAVNSIARPPDGCPESYPYEIAALCYARSGVLTTCGYGFAATLTVPNSCPPGTENFASACYGNCPADSPRTSLCTCSNLDIKTNCIVYGDAKGMEDALGPNCNSSYERYAGLCYGRCPAGMTRTAACTCSNKEVITSCELYGDGRPIGDPLGPQCGDSADLWGGLCYEEKCPAGTNRTASCTCSNYEIRTSCAEFGDPRGLKDPENLGPKCTPEEDYFGGFCYSQKCPMDQSRTAACTCDNFGTIVNCDLFGDGRGILDGDGLGPVCEDDEDWHAGLCYKDKCPEGFRRSAICTCQKLKTLKGFIGLG